MWKFSSRDLNPDLCPSRPTNTYTCGVTITPKVCDSIIWHSLMWMKYFAQYSHIFTSNIHFTHNTKEYKMKGYEYKLDSKQRKPFYKLIRYAALQHIIVHQYSRPREDSRPTHWPRAQDVLVLRDSFFVFLKPLKRKYFNEITPITPCIK